MVVTKDPGLEDVLLSLKETKDTLIQETIKQIKYWKKMIWIDGDVAQDR